MMRAEQLASEFSRQFSDGAFPADFLAAYELLECLGYSDLGETYLVKERKGSTHYIAKCYPVIEGEQPVHEAELLKNLKHDGLPRFIAQFQNEQMVCVVRTYQCGQNLQQLVAERELNSRQMLSIASQLCDLLIYLHSQSPAIIHRDIKPQNIIIDDNLNVSLIDFGISRLYKQGATEDTVHMGTREFAAPEQFGYCQTDERSDIYSMGVVFHWLLKKISANGQRIPKGILVRLRRVIARSTSFDPKDRYQSAKAVKQALTGKTVFLWGSVAGLLVVAGLIGLAQFTGIFGAKGSSEIHFSEPLIEQAVRLSLHKADDDPLLADDLNSITNLYVFGDHAAASNEEFRTYADSFAQNTGQIGRGSIKTLADLKYLPNLRSLAVPYQNITQLNSLPDLFLLEEVDLRHNAVEDVTPLAKIPKLQTLSLYETLVSDLTPLANCKHLANLDIGKSQVTSTTALDGLSSLVILKANDAPINSLENLQKHLMLQEVSLHGVQVINLTALQELPKLKLLELDESMRPFAEDQLKNAGFKIQFTQ
jgi:serine/threonine protein kinase